MKGDSSQGNAGGIALANIFLPGLYAWLSTILLPALSPQVSWWARGVAFLGLLALSGGVLTATRWPLVGRWLGIYCFLGLSLVCWVLLRNEIDIRRIEPSRAALGALGFALFAVGWGSVRRRGHVPEKDPRVIPGSAPAPYSRSPCAARGIFALLVLVSLIPVVLAWRVTRQDQAVFAHVALLTAAIVCISTAANIATSLGKWQAQGSPGTRLNHASTALTLLAVFATIGMLVQLF
jgi:hypothetical protein